MTRRGFFVSLLMAALVPALAACGRKGPLRRPTPEEKEEKERPEKGAGTG